MGEYSAPSFSYIREHVVRWLFVAKTWPVEQPSEKPNVEFLLERESRGHSGLRLQHRSGDIRAMRAPFKSRNGCNE